MIFLYKQNIDFVSGFTYIYISDWLYSGQKLLESSEQYIVWGCFSLLTLSLNLLQLCSRETKSEVEGKLVRKTYVINGVHMLEHNLQIMQMEYTLAFQIIMVLLVQ